MRYMLLLYASEAASDALQRDREALAAQHGSCYALSGTASATTVRLRGGRTLLSDGPFAETREQLIGLLLVEARDLDEAIAIAERAPDARLGSVEIRPVRESP